MNTRSQHLKTIAMVRHDELGLPRRIAIMAALVSTQLIQTMPFGAGLDASLRIGQEIGASDGRAAWLAASYPMTQGAFVLIGGRFGDVFGHKNVLLGGAVWWVVWSLVSGFAKNVVTLSLFRGLTGMGGAFIVPNAVALIAHTFPPGRMRNIAMGSFGAMAPVGAAGGTAVSALFVQLTPWKWLFFFFALLGAVGFSAVMLLVPDAPPSDKGGKIDWIGSYLGVGGLILFNFVWNQAPIAGWDKPYEYALLIVAILHLATFILWEAKAAVSPILPFDIWTAPSVSALIVVVFLSFMSFGIFGWYISCWHLNIRGGSLLTAAAEIQPFTVCGAIAAITAAWLIPRLPAQYILAIGATAMVIANILLATMPAQQIYWQTSFFAVCFAAFCPDFIFTASQIIASNSVARNEQGIAGSLIGTLLTYGISTGIGFGGTVEVHTNRGGTDTVRGYRSALYLGIGFAAASLALSLIFVRIKKDDREGWDDEDGAGQEMKVPNSTSMPFGIPGDSSLSSEARV